MERWGVRHGALGLAEHPSPSGLPPPQALPRGPTPTDVPVGQALQQARLLVARGRSDAGSQLTQVTLSDLQ